MPVVPLQTAPGVMPEALPSVRQQTPYRMMQGALIGPGEMQRMGQGALHAGNEMLRELTQDQIQQNEAKAKDHDAGVMAEIQGVLYGTPDNPDAGYLNQKGKTAVDGYQDAVARLGKVAENQAATLDNPAQQQLVKTATQARIQSAITQATQHRSQQSDVYQQTAGQVRIKAAQDGAALSYDPVSDTPTPKFDAENPAANSQYQQALQTIRSEANDQADRKGLTDPDLRDAFVKDAMQKAYLGTLSHLLDGKGKPADTKVAQQYFDAVKGNLTAEQQDKVKAVLEAGAQKDQALQLALEVKAYAGNIGAQEDELDSRFKAGKISAEVHDMALQKLRADNAQRRGEQAESDKAMIGNAWDLARQGKTLADMTPRDIAYIKTRGLGPHIDAIFKKGGDNTDFDDSKMYVDQMRMASEDPAGFVRQDLSLISGQLSQAHWNHLVGIQASINRQDAKGMEINKIQAGAVRDARAQILAAGLNLSPKPNTSASQQLDQFTSALHDQLAAAQEDWAAKKLTPAQMREEARNITLGLLKDQALSGTGYFGDAFGVTHKKPYQMTPEEMAKPWTIPDAERTQIKAALQRAGQPVDEATIQRVYKAKQGVR